jgi:hypothetical protein
MLEARLQEAALLKRLLDCKLYSRQIFMAGLIRQNFAAIKELVTDANFECNEEGIVGLLPPAVVSSS